MERARAMFGVGHSRWWTATTMHVPMVLFALAAFLLVRNAMGGGGEVSRPPIAAAGPDYAATRDADIAFFEGRVVETRDSLSYNRLVSLYLQRYRERGDVADIGRAEVAAVHSTGAAPGNYSSIVALASVRLVQHDFSGAEELAREAMVQRPTLADAHAILGDALFAMGRYDEADSAYRVVLDKAPGPAAFSRLASVAEVRGNTDLAEQFWTAAIDSEMKPEPAAWASVQLGHLYFVLGDLDRAEASLARALEAFPDYPHALAGRGKVAAARGDWPAAAQYLNQAVTIAPYIDYVGTLGDVLALDGQIEAAERQFQLVHALTSLEAANGIRGDLTALLFALDHGGATAEVLTAARQAFEERPSVAAADAYAWALYRTGDMEGAWKHIQIARATGKRDPQFAFHAAAIAQARGDTSGARAFLAELDMLNARFVPAYDEEITALRAAVQGGGR
ncbi:MAG: tetratricopeptide repeat protein [Dehalococcoidia bacterium]|nr:tetratricopeptide repeat protein [Dehalococcoidia bacterium]MCB9486205.1 tetratricopeptide repeat protein [Thermoflexaceae bacterium]